MSERRRRKPIPARPQPPAGGSKPTPARELTGEPAAATPQADVAQVSLEVDDETWTVRVLGRSGRRAASSPPMLLLGFWHGDADGDPSLERLVVGSTLTDLSRETLREALAMARKPREPGRKKPFFEGAGQARRRGRKAT